MDHRPSYLIARHAASEYKRKNRKDEINLSAIARKTGCTVSSLWFYFNEKRRWPVDSWLKVLNELGSIEVRQNELVIFFPTKNVLKEFIKK